MHYCLLAVGEDFERQLSRYGMGKGDRPRKNTRFDGYTVGGRYAGSLLVKEGVKPILAGPSLSNPAVRIGQHTLPVWAAEELASTGTLRHADQAKMGEVDWAGMTEEFVESRRQQYRTAHRFALENPNDSEAFLELWEIRSGESEEEYAQRGARRWVPYALVAGGRWISRRCADGRELGTEEWEQRFWSEMANLDLGDLLTVIDCHS